MGRYALRRCILAIPTIFGVILLAFVLARITGDPARFVLGEEAPPEALAQFRQDYGLDQPILVQFGHYLLGLVKGDLGNSIRYNLPVWDLFWQRMPATLTLGLSTYVFSLIVGLSLGVISAVRQGGVVDRLVRILVAFGQAVPGFYLGLLLIIFVAMRLGWFPTGGRGGFSHIVLPTITLSSTMIAVLVRFTRSMMLDVIGSDYIRTARAKGLSEPRVIASHAFRNAVIPLITVLGLQTGIVFSGAVVTETVFSWPR